MHNAFLSGKSIYFRIIESRDLTENYQGWFNDAEVCQFNSHHRFPNYREDMAEYYNNIIKSKNNIILAIIDQQTDVHVGNIALQDINLIDRSAELAIIIGNKDYWGRGVGKEAGVLMMNHGFDGLNLHRIYCGTSVDNLGMQKLALALGFKQEGVAKDALYKNGEYRDIIHYGIIKDGYSFRK